MLKLFWVLWICQKEGSPELHPHPQGAPRLLMRERLCSCPWRPRPSNVTNIHPFIQQELYLLSPSYMAITLYPLSNLIHTHTWEVGVITPMLQIQTMRSRKVKLPDQCDSVGWASTRKWKVSSSIPSQVIYRRPWVSSPIRAWERQQIDISLLHQCFSPSLSLSLPFSLK